MGDDDDELEDSVPLGSMGESLQVRTTSKAYGFRVKFSKVRQAGSVGLIPNTSQSHLALFLFQTAQTHQQLLEKQVQQAVSVINLLTEEKPHTSGKQQG